MNLDFYWIVYWIILVPLFIYVFSFSVLRINHLHPRRHKYTWSLMYLLIAAFTATVLGTSLWYQHPEWDSLVALTAFALQIALTRRKWQDKPPEDTERGDLA